MLRPSEKGAVHNTFEPFNSIGNYTGGLWCWHLAIVSRILSISPLFMLLNEKAIKQKPLPVTKDQGCVWMSGWQAKLLALPKFNLFCKDPLNPLISCIAEGLIITIFSKKPSSVLIWLFRANIGSQERNMSVSPSSFRWTEYTSSSASRQHQHPGKHSPPAGPGWSGMCAFK